MNPEPEKRCICGNSRLFPICDGSHRSKNWECRGRPGQVTEWCFVAGPHNENLAAKLSAEFRGVAADIASGEISAARLVVISEGTDLDTVVRLASRVNAPRKMVVAVNIDAAMLAHAFPGWPIRAVQGGNSIELWQQIRSVCASDAKTSRPQPMQLQAAFLSHAVADEPLIQQPIEYLRRFYNADIFVCADSVPSGAVWHEQILGQLKERDLFVLLLSRSSLSSTFSAFEAGHAMALGKTVALISLDGSPPPTFVQHLQMTDLERMRRLAPWLDPEEVLLEALLQILAAREGARPIPRAPQSLYTILFTDIEGSTSITQRVGDAEAQEVLHTHNKIVRDALKAHRGSEIKHTGDGIMVSFPSATQALECAIAMQRAFAEHNKSADEPIRVRVGLNAGEPVAEDQDLFGTAVQLARRICDHAEPEQVLTSDLVRGLAAGKGFSFSPQADIKLKGFEDSLQLYELRWREDA